MADLLLPVGFIFFVLILASFVIRLIAKGINIIASPPVNVFAFICAKACAFGSCLFIPLTVFFPSLRWNESTLVSTLIALALFIPGAEIAVAAMKKLGDDLIFGLPEGNIGQLRTSGIFAFSRNPLYLGFIMIIASSWINNPHPINLALGIIAVALHHLIIIREEGYLIAVRGIEYHAYMRTVGRYLPGI